ncbi:MAG: hypothetical protein AAGG01_17105, partial [Planctomycetota bacterium]
MRLPIATVLSLVVLSSDASANRTWVVDPLGTGDFTVLAPALAAAADGDTVLVLPGSQAGGPLVIDGKGISVLANARAPFNERFPEIVVRNVPAGSVTLLRRLELAAESATAPGIKVENCAGRVRIESCHSTGFAGADVRSCTDVTIVSSLLSGYDPGRLQPVPVTAALHVVDSLVVVDESVVAGQNGAFPQSGGLFCIEDAGDGTTAVAAKGSSIVRLIGGIVRAGFPGPAEGPCKGGAFASAVFASSGAHVVQRDVDLVGSTALEGGSFVELAGERRAFVVTDHVRSEGAVRVRASGDPGEVLFALVAQDLGTRYLGDETGTYQMPNVIPGGRIFLGVLDGAGRLEVDLPVPATAADETDALFVQGAFISSSGTVRLAAVRSVTVFGDDVPVRVAGETVHVDPSAASAGAGTSWQAPTSDLDGQLRRAFASVGSPVSFWLREGFHRAGPAGTAAEIVFMVPGTRLLGGFAGTETEEGQRDPLVRTSWVDGDRNGDDQPGFVNRADNASRLLDARGTVFRPTMISGVGFR